MSGSYRQCVQCGKSALKFATRCPGCGIALPDPAPFGEGAGPQLTWSHSLAGVAAVVLIGIAVVSLERRETGPATPSVETATVTSVVAERPEMIETPALVEALPAVAVTPANRGRMPLIAKAWTNVHGTRSASAPLEAVLTPGDTVTADSLVNGWYRVSLYDEVLGWAKEGTLK